MVVRHRLSGSAASVPRRRRSHCDTATPRASRPCHSAAAHATDGSLRLGRTVGAQCNYPDMDEETSPEYLRALADPVRAFKAALESFLELHVENTGPIALARGMMPAVFPRDGADGKEIERRRPEVALAAGRIAAVAPLVGMYIQVQGAGTVDPFSAWLSITQPKPILEPSNILDACDQAIGRLEGKAIKAEAELPPKIGVVSMHPLIWGAAGPLWRDGHYRQAVNAAADSLIAQVKALTGRNDIPETSLWQEGRSRATRRCRASRGCAGRVIRLTEA